MSADLFQAVTAPDAQALSPNIRAMHAKALDPLFTQSCECASCRAAQGAGKVVH